MSVFRVSLNYCYSSFCGIGCNEMTYKFEHSLFSEIFEAVVIWVQSPVEDGNIKRKLMWVIEC